MSGKYVMEPDGTIRREDDIIAWGEAFKNNRTVAYDTVDDANVSTVFLGLDHSFGHGPPVLFETMIFGGKHDQYQQRYCTRDEALAGHARVAMALARGETP